MEIKPGYFEQERTLKNAVQTSELSGVPAADRDRVLKTALAIYPEVEQWVSQFPVILPYRIAATCLACSAISPDAEPDAIVAASLISLIYWAEDDVTDGVIGFTPAPEQVEAMLSLYGSIVSSGGKSTYRDYPDLIKFFPAIDDSQPWAQVSNALTKFCQKLQQFPAAATYYRCFARHFELAMAANRTELHWWQEYKATGKCPVTYQDSIQVGRESIAGAVIMTALLAMLGAPVDSSFIPPHPYTNLDSFIDEVALVCGASIRLANDTRSFERERAMDQKLNSILILMLTQDLNEQEAEAIVISDTDVYLQQMEALVASLPSGLQAWGDTVSRMGWFARDWYQTREFHHFTKEMLAALSKN